jgi:hypothetical protein
MITSGQIASRQQICIEYPKRQLLHYSSYLFKIAIYPFSKPTLQKINGSFMSKSWLTTIFLNFFIAASMGFLLRLAHVVEIPLLDFRHLMHAHSHVAMLGWLFLLFYGLILDGLVAPSEAKKPIYKYLFWAAQICVVGMMVSFSIQGYGAVSILFTSVHLMLAYIIAAKLYFNIRNAGTYSGLFIRTALVLMAVSTLGVWALGLIKAGLFGNSVLYYASIQFFLHFQFNGWFTFAALALVFHQIEQSGQPLPKKVTFRWFYGLLLSSLVLTYALSVVWSTPEVWLFWTNGAGVLIQLIALGVFLSMIVRYRDVFMSKSERLRNFLYFLVLLSFSAKILIQTAVVIPQVAVISYTIRPFVVGFIHLTMLGSISLYLMVYMMSQQMLNLDRSSIRYGVLFIAFGFLITEALLFSQGLFLWMRLGFFSLYYELILIGTAFIPLGILLVTSRILHKNYQPIHQF